MNMILKKNKSELKYYIPLALAFLLLIVLNILFGQNWIDSDMSAEMVFSDLLGKTGHYIATDNWYYSTEFRILYTQLLFVPLLKIIESWAVVRVITNIITYVILILSYFFMMHGMEKRYVALTSTILLLPVSEAIAQHMQFGNTYMPHMILLFLSLGLVRRLDHAEKNIKTVICWAVLLILSFICGASGVRYFLIIYAPLLITAVLRTYTLCGIREGALKRWFAQLGLFRIAFFASLSAFAGYIFNTVYIRSIYEFTTYESVFFVPINNGIWYERVASVIGCFLEIFGYIPGGSVLSLRGIVTLAAFVMIFLLFILVKRTSKEVFEGSGMLGSADDFTDDDVSDMFFVHFFASSLAVMTFFLTFTGTTLTPRYFSTCLYMALPVLVIWLIREDDMAVRQVYITALAFCLILSTLKITYSLATNDKNKARREVVEYILSNPSKYGLKGYSFFEDSNVLMELSDGELTVRAVTSDLSQIFRWSTGKIFPSEERMWTMSSIPSLFIVFPEDTDVTGFDVAYGEWFHYDTTVAGYDIYCTH